MTGVGVHDPDGVIRHRAIRTTIAMTAGFAVGVLVVDDVGVALFASFGAFALLGLADFGGEPRRRTHAYLALILVGGALVALGTTASRHVAVGAALLFLVTFAVRLLAVFGGGFAVGGPAALLVFVVATMVPGPPDQIPSRLLGWCLASALSLALATLLWPVHQRQVIRLGLAGIVDDLGAYVRALVAAPAIAAADDPAATDHRRRAIAALIDRIHDLRDRYGRSDSRPAGPTQHDQGLIRLVDQLERSISFAGRAAPPAATERLDPAAASARSGVDDVALGTAVADALDHTAAVLRRTAAAEVDDELATVRDHHRARLDGWVGDALAAGVPADVVVDRLRRVFPLRVLSHSVLECETDAVVSVGGSASDDQLLVDVPRADGARTVGVRSVALLRPHLRPSSVVFRNALRGSAALAAALVVADLVHAEHGFWVVLGTLTVLKSSAMRTGITAVQAIGGNVIGFAVASVVMLTVGDAPVVLWFLLPVTIFLAVYAPGAIHFVVGQASFTVLVVVLFNILQPEGWRTGLVRVESVALGAAISVLVGVVFWPRGNRLALHDTTAALYRSVATYLTAALGTVTGAVAVDDLAPSRRATVAAQQRADQALFDLLVTPNATSSVPAWSRLAGVGRSLRLVGDGVRDLALLHHGPIADADDHAALDAMGTARAAEVAGVADRLDGTDPPPAGPVADRTAAWFDELDPSDPGAVERTVGLAWAVEWLDVVDALVALDDEPLAAVTAAAAVPWWR